MVSLSIKKTPYLRVSTTQYIDHDLHDSFVHAKGSHQVGMLVENLVTHDVPKKKKKQNIFDTEFHPINNFAFGYKD